MSKIKIILNRMRRNPNDIRFRDLFRICEYYFGPHRIKKSSHRVYKMPWPGDPRINIQNEQGKAKAYQVKQVLKAIEKWERENAHKD